MTSVGIVRGTGLGRSQGHTTTNRGSLWRPHWLLAGSVAIVIAGCHVQLVSEYDEIFATAAASTQKEIDGFLQKQRNPPSGTDLTYEGNKSAYNEIEVDLDSLLVLAKSHPNNDPSINQVNAVIETVHGLADVHRGHTPLPADFIDEKRRTLMIEFSSIIRTENDKKAGK